MMRSRNVGSGGRGNSIDKEMEHKEERESIQNAAA
jgi:hypothetical protein